MEEVTRLLNALAEDFVIETFISRLQRFGSRLPAGKCYFLLRRVASVLSPEPTNQEVTYGNEIEASFWLQVEQSALASLHAFDLSARLRKHAVPKSQQTRESDSAQVQMRYHNNEAAHRTKSRRP